MTSKALLIEVRWPDGRFHGVRETRAEERGRGRGAGPIAPEWPPSPFRLFQALVAGAYGGRWAGEDGEAQTAKDAAFRWLEALDPPLVAAPSAQALAPVTYFVPNNDLDAKGGDPAKVAEIRTGKVLRTSLFDADRPAAYLWRFDGDAAAAERLAELAGRLHTLGHGIDAAFARAEVLDAGEAERRLAALGGSPRRPAKGPAGGGASAPCPARGSLDSLRRRHLETAGKFQVVRDGRKSITRFSQPSKAHARLVAYERAPERRLYELRQAAGGPGFAAWPLERAGELARAVRDLVEGNLKRTWAEAVERCVVGRTAGPADAALRLRIVPLPTLRDYGDNAIRRVLVEAPPDFPIPIGDVEWALAGRELADADGVLGGELGGVLLVPASDTAMLERYAVTARVWRTVTPAALPWHGARGKLSGEARARSEAEAAGAVTAALRHAGVGAPVRAVRVQREPFDLRGERADAFSVAAFNEGRFDPRDLRHVEVAFDRPVAWPLALGDGRFLGLGVLRPVAEAALRTGVDGRGVHLFALDGPPLRPQDAEAVTRALRRAVMSRARDALHLRANDPMPSFFSGHEPASAPGVRTPPAKGGTHRHLFFGFDPGGASQSPRLAVVEPYRADHSPEVFRTAKSEHEALRRALAGLQELRAGPLGVFSLTPVQAAEGDPMLGPGRRWISATAYRPTRHPKRGEDGADALVDDVRRELARRHIPGSNGARIEVLERHEGPRRGLFARLRLTFAAPVKGPLLLGARSHFGFGLFERDRVP